MGGVSAGRQAAKPIRCAVRADSLATSRRTREGLHALAGRCSTWRRSFMPHLPTRCARSYTNAGTQSRQLLRHNLSRAMRGCGRHGYGLYRARNNDVYGAIPILEQMPDRPSAVLDALRWNELSWLTKDYTAARRRKSMEKALRSLQHASQRLSDVAPWRSSGGGIRSAAWMLKDLDRTDDAEDAFKQAVQIFERPRRRTPGGLDETRPRLPVSGHGPSEFVGTTSPRLRTGVPRTWRPPAACRIPQRPWRPFARKSDRRRNPRASGARRAG